MVSWSVAHRIAGVRFYYEIKSIIQTQRRLRQQFNIPRHGLIPSHNVTLAGVRKFEDTGSVTDIAHGAPRTVHTEENVRRVKESFEQSPHRLLGNNHASSTYPGGVWDESCRISSFTPTRCR